MSLLFCYFGFFSLFLFFLFFQKIKISSLNFQALYVECVLARFVIEVTRVDMRTKHLL